MKSSILCTLLFFIILQGPAVLAANETTAQTKLTPSQIFAFKRIERVTVSGDGQKVAFTSFQSAENDEGKHWKYSLYLKNGEGDVRLLLKEVEASQIIWSSDNKYIYYLAPGKKFQSAWSIDVQNRKTKKIVEFTTDIDSFKFSPNGQDIAFTANTSQQISNKATTSVDVSKNYSNEHLYIYSHRLVSLLTAIEYNVSDFDWNPDNKTIAFSFYKRIDAIQNQYSEKKIALINVATKEINTLPYTEDHQGIQPSFSPDGKWIAFATSLPKSKFATEFTADIGINKQICVSNTTSFESYCLDNTFNKNPNILGWDNLSKNVLVIDTYKSKGYLIYSLNLNSEKPVKTISAVDGFIEPLTITLNNTRTYFGFGYETTSTAPEAFISKVEPFKLEQISYFSNSNVQLGQTETIHWKSLDGKEIEGLLTTPPDFNQNKKYPLYIALHGGPTENSVKRYFGGCNEYAEMIEPTSCLGNMLNLGFIILQPNIRGSDGFGLEYRAANFADLGGGDYQDIISGIDNLIKIGVVDPDHLAIGGWSYGGYMTAWVISQTPRFKAAIDGDGNTDFISFSGTSDLVASYYSEYLGNNFWENNTLYLERAPIMHTKDIVTPLLILHGEKDGRVPLSQAYELYTALKIQKKTVKMFVLPNQHHMPTDPNVIFESINKINDWLKKAL
jgi:dipeptidyl aminopeptidase/acylaminoacyl peptidase